MSDTDTTFPVDPAEVAGSVADIMASTFPGPTSITRQGPTVMPGPSIVQAIAAIIGELPALGKDDKAPASMGGYSFRGVEAIMAALKPLLAKHGVITVPTTVAREVSERQVNQSKTMFVTDVHVEWQIFGPAGDSVTASTWGQGTDMGDKATQKAYTSAYKSMLGQLFAIADSATDSERHDVPDTVRGAPAGDWYQASGWENKAEHDDAKGALRDIVSSFDDPKLAGWLAWKAAERIDTSKALTRPQFDASCAALSLISAGTDPSTGEIGASTPDSAPPAPRTAESAPSDQNAPASAESATDGALALSTEQTEGGLTFDQVMQLDKRSCVAELGALGLATNGTLEELRNRLADSLQPF